MGTWQGNQYTCVQSASNIKAGRKVQTVEITKTVDIAISPTLVKTYPRSTAVHHIVARKASQALPARRLLEAYLVRGVENSHNLVVLPIRSHWSLHTPGYYTYINIRIISAALKGSSAVEKAEDIQFELDQLAKELTGASYWIDISREENNE